MYVSCICVSKGAIITL